MNTTVIDDIRDSGRPEVSATRGGWPRELARRWPLALGMALGVTELFGQEPWRPGDYTTWLLPVVALVYLLFGLARGRSRRRGVLTVQTAGLVGFGLVAVVALAVEPSAGRYVVAAGWLGHAVWDLVHLRRNLVVPRGIAEFCVVFDVLLAASLIVAPTS